VSSTGRTVVKAFESVDAQLEECTKAVKAGHVHWGDERGAFNRPEFIGREFADWTAVRDTANQLWQEGVEIVEELMAELSRFELPHPTNRRRKARWSEDAGDEIDNDRLRAGQEPWRECVRQRTHGTQTKVIVSFNGTSAYQDHREILWRGAASLCLANLLEAAGYSVEIWTCDSMDCAFKNGDAILNATKVKRADQPLDTATIVNSLAGWFYRTVTFESHYTVEGRRDVVTSMGYPKALSAASPELQQITEGADTIVVDGVFDRSAAIELVRSVIASLEAK
jgi:hypothetical protein